MTGYYLRIQIRLQNNFESIVYYCGVRGWKHRKNMRSTAPVFFLASTVLMMIMAKINFVLAHPKICTQYSIGNIEKATDYGRLMKPFFIKIPNY